MLQRSAVASTNNIIERITAFDPKNEQDVYLSGLLSAKKIIRRRNLNTKNSTKDLLRKKSFDYNIELQGEKMKICKTAFIINIWNNTKPTSKIDRFEGL